jgi:3-hydroxybutyryl-CoA dehydrogenase
VSDDGWRSGATAPLRVVVIGAGLMASQIGLEYALAGHVVTFGARHRERVSARVQAAFDLIAEHQLRSGDELARARAAVTVADDVAAALVGGFDLAVESVTEDLALKAELLGQAAAAEPNAILATNTSSLSITELGRAADCGTRLVGTHYWNPPLLMPPVEVVAGDETAPDVLARTVAIIAGNGKQPVVVNRDVPGFIWNRLQHALLREVMWLVENDVASPEDIDQVVRSGLSRRSRYTGPFETIALGGVDAWQRVAQNLFPVLSTERTAQDLQRWITYAPDDLAQARERRDHGLVEELKERRP